MGSICSISSRSQVENHLSTSEIEELHQLTNLSIKEIVNHHREFLRISPGGTMTREDFEKLLRATDSPANESMFDMIDKDASGSIKFREYLLSLVMFSRQTQPEQELGAVFDSYLAFLRSKSKENNNSTFDHGLSRVDVENLIKRIHPSINQEDIQIVVRRYMETDSNKNGLISKQEFIAACMKNAPLMTALGHREAIIKIEEN